MPVDGGQALAQLVQLETLQAVAVALQLVLQFLVMARRVGFTGQPFPLVRQVIQPVAVALQMAFH